MELQELEPQFLKIKDERNFLFVDNITEADGMSYLCPVCFKNNGNSSKGVHSILSWQPHVPEHMTPGPGRWNFVGTGYNDLSFVNGSSSIALTGGCNAHFFIKEGKIIFC